MATHDPPPHGAKPEKAPADEPTAAAPAPAAGGAPEVETKQYVYHVNPATNQVLKVEELDPKTGQRQEVPVSYPTHDPYAAYDPQGGDPYGGQYGQGADPYGGHDPYAGHDPYGAYPHQGGHAAAMGHDPYAAAPSIPQCLPPRCIPPRCWPPRCWPPRCWPPTCLPQFPEAQAGPMGMAASPAVSYPRCFPPPPRCWPPTCWPPRCYPPPPCIM